MKHVNDFNSWAGEEAHSTNEAAPGFTDFKMHRDIITTGISDELLSSIEWFANYYVKYPDGSRFKAMNTSLKRLRDDMKTMQPRR